MPLSPQVIKEDSLSNLNIKSTLHYLNISYEEHRISAADKTAVQPKHQAHGTLSGRNRIFLYLPEHKFTNLTAESGKLPLVNLQHRVL